MEKSPVRVAVVGYGHIAREAVKAINAAQDMEIAGIVIRDPGKVDEISRQSGLPVFLGSEKLDGADVAILAIASRAVPEVAPPTWREVSAPWTVSTFTARPSCFSERDFTDRRLRGTLRR